MLSEAEKIKTEFQQQGVSISTWARSRGFDSRLVYAVLGGKNKASRGRSHLIAVALGLKAEAPASELTERLGLVGLAGVTLTSDRVLSVPKGDFMSP